jgi:hypothetical protein
VFITITLGFAEANSVYDRGMIEFIRDNSAVFTQKGFEDSAIGVKAG